MLYFVCAAANETEVVFCEGQKLVEKGAGWKLYTMLRLFLSILNITMNYLS